MRLIRIFNKGIKDAFKSTFRNFSLSIASISCITITLIIVALALFATYNVNNITRKIEGVLEIVVFVDRDASDDEIAELKQEINTIKNVDESKTEYRSKEELAEKLRREDESFASMLDTLDSNPLQPTFVVFVNDVMKISDTATKIKGLHRVTTVKYGESLVNKMLNVFGMLRNGFAIAVIALVFVTAFLVGNTIKITIFSRRQEIQIMRLVGTSNTVIKLPFLIEGLILGVIGGALASIISLFAYYFLYDFTNGTLFTSLAPLVNPSTIILDTTIVLLLIGGLVGMFGSLLSARKYLKI